MSLRIGHRHHVPGIFGLKGLIDFGVQIFCSVEKTLRRYSAAFCLIPDRRDSGASVTVSEYRIHIINSGIQKTNQNTLSLQGQGRLILYPQYPACFQCAFIHQRITFRNGRIVIILNIQRKTSFPGQIGDIVGSVNFLHTFAYGSPEIRHGIFHNKIIIVI